jgi:hypothetical protein
MSFARTAATATSATVSKAKSRKANKRVLLDWVMTHLKKLSHLDKPGTMELLSFCGSSLYF